MLHHIVFSPLYSSTEWMYEMVLFNTGMVLEHSGEATSNGFKLSMIYTCQFEILCSGFILYKTFHKSKVQTLRTTQIRIWPVKVYKVSKFECWNGTVSTQ